MSSLPTVTYEIEEEKYELKVNKRCNITKYAELCAKDYYKNFSSTVNHYSNLLFEFKLKINEKYKGNFMVTLEYNTYMVVRKKR